MSRTKKNDATLGIDLGGSNIFSVVYNSRNEIIAQDKIDTDAKKGYVDVIDRLREHIHNLEEEIIAKGYSLTGVGLGVPGVITGSGDTIRVAPNLGWENVRPLYDLGLNQRRELQAVLVNDVNAGLMGELTLLPSPPTVTVAYFCGTGVGGALAIDGKLIQGFDGGAGEVGHMVVETDGLVCGCGRTGCLEAYIGKWALNRIISKAIDKKKTSLKKIISYDLEKKPVKSSSLKKAYEEGDEFTVELMNETYSRYLAIGISQLVNFINPELVILGGGIIESMGHGLLPHIFRHLQEHIINTPPQLRLAELGDFAGPAGAAYLSRQS